MAIRFYCHANPVNAIDPTGKITAVQVCWAIAALVTLSVVSYTLYKVIPLLSSRGDTIYLNFKNMDLSGINLLDEDSPEGYTAPNKYIVQEKILQKMRAAFTFKDFNISVSTDNAPSWLSPEIVFSNDKNAEIRGENEKLKGILWGGEKIGSPKGEVHVNAFQIKELNGKFDSNEQLATAIAYIAIHEAGHIYGLGHKNVARNYMRSSAVLNGNFKSTDEKGKINEIVEALLMSNSFDKNQILKLQTKSGLLYE